MMEAINTQKPDLTLEQIENDLKTAYSNLNFSYRKNLTGKHLIVSESSTIGFGVWVKDGKIKIDSVLPSLKWLLLGAGSVMVFWFNVKQRKALEERLLDFFAENYIDFGSSLKD